MPDFEDNNSFEQTTEEELNNGSETNNIIDLITQPLIEDEDIEEFEDERTEIDTDTEDRETETKDFVKEKKNRFKRLSKLGAKGIVKGLDLSNANLCRKISFSDSALEYRADKEAIEDLTEVVEEIIPKKNGEKLRIPLWTQLIIFLLIAFLPTIFSAFSDRSENRELKEQKRKKKKLKQENKLLKKKLQNIELEKELEQTLKQEINDENAVNILNGKGDKTDKELENENTD